MPLILPLSIIVPSLKGASLLSEASDISPGSQAIVPSEFRPSIIVNIQYPGGKSVILGNELTPEETKDEPKVEFMGLDPMDEEATYMLVLVDPDAPSPQDRKYSPWRHWVQPGLKPMTLTEIEEKSKSAQPSENGGFEIVRKTLDAATSYKGPGPNKGTGFHRYLFLLYHSASSPSITAEDTGGHEFTSRRAWNVTKFTEEKGLKLVGANWFKCRNNEDREAGLE